MVTRAQLTQERSRARRDALLAAAIDLFAEGGSRAITHRAVAARAGLPPATTTYYFASIEELIREALGTHLVSWIAELDALAQVDLAPAVEFDEAAGLIEGLFARRGPEVVLLELSIFLAASREPALRGVATRAAQSLEGVGRHVLERIGVPDPERLSAVLIALICGTGLRRQTDAYSEAEEARMLTSAIRDLIGAHLMAPGVVDDALATLADPERRPA